MFDSLLSATALPNLHPAVVHFPIAFLPLALAFDAAGLILRRQRWLVQTATTVYSVAALSAWLAVWAGEQAADSLVGIPAAVQPRIGQHSDWAHYALYALATMALLRLVVHLRPKLTDHRGARIVMVLLGLATFGVLAKAADLGGALVYQHGLAVQRPAVAQAAPTGTVTPSSEETADTARDRLVRSGDGTLVWLPAPEDSEALGAVLTAAPGSDLDTVRVEEPAGAGLKLTTDDRPATLLLPGIFGDVQVEAELELLDFEGTIGLVHHYREPADRGAFSISTQGDAILDDLRQGERTLLDQQAFEFPSGPVVVAVSAAGKHLKGLVDGKTVTHGHIAPGPEGSCGLLLEGTGTLRLLRMTVQPLEPH